METLPFQPLRPCCLRWLFQRTGAPPFSDHSDGIKRSWTWDKRPAITFLFPTVETNELRSRRAGEGNGGGGFFKIPLDSLIKNDMSPRWALWLKSSLNTRLRCGGMLDEEFFFVLFVIFFKNQTVRDRKQVESSLRSKKLSCFFHWEFVFFESWPAPRLLSTCEF